MELAEDKIFGRYTKQCKRCMRNKFLPFEYKLRCIFMRM